MRDLGQAPVVLLLIVALVLGFEFLFLQAELPDVQPTGDEVSTEGGGFLGFLGGVFDTVSGAIALFFNLVTLNIPGAPPVVRFVWGTVVGGAFLWGLVEIILP